LHRYDEQLEKKSANMNVIFDFIKQ